MEVEGCGEVPHSSLFVVVVLLRRLVCLMPILAGCSSCLRSFPNVYERPGKHLSRQDPNLLQLLLHSLYSDCSR